ncbi:MAG: signal recognition particle-docking protein FtsY [Syntrophobacterales bacterium]|nr:signal recognition particle-docking protein FtsY [Syntrophobacterales bacterium]
MIWWRKKVGLPEENKEEGQVLGETQIEKEPELENSERREGLWKRLVKGLQKTRDHFTSRIEQLFSGRKTIDRELFDELEEILITSDVGVAATRRLLNNLEERVERESIQELEILYKMLEEEIIGLLSIPAEPLDPNRADPFVIMVVGVNGVGKTTTIAKLANHWKTEGKKPLVVAGDTFRAAAIDQLAMWAERVGVPIIKQRPGADPSAVVYDALDAAVSRGYDLVIIDTAGRMHTKSNLMEELKKIRRVMAKKIPEAPHETFLVLDATTGQNAYSQVKTFKEEISISGLILTKLDGTAKGGVVIGICHEFGIPIRFIGVGEGIEDLRPFQPELFAKALLGH